MIPLTLKTFAIVMATTWAMESVAPLLKWHQAIAFAVTGLCVWFLACAKEIGEALDG